MHADQKTENRNRGVHVMFHDQWEAVTVDRLIHFIPSLLVSLTPLKGIHLSMTICRWLVDHCRHLERVGFHWRCPPPLPHLSQSQIWVIERCHYYDWSKDSQNVFIKRLISIPFCAWEIARIVSRPVHVVQWPWRRIAKLWWRFVIDVRSSLSLRSSIVVSPIWRKKRRNSSILSCKVWLTSIKTIAMALLATHPSLLSRYRPNFGYRREFSFQNELLIDVRLSVLLISMAERWLSSSIISFSFSSLDIDDKRKISRKHSSEYQCCPSFPSSRGQNGSDTASN